MIEIKPNDKRAQSVIVVFYLYLCVAIVFGLFSVYTSYFYSSLANGTYYSEQTIGLVSIGEVAIGLATFSANIACIVLFILWFRRAYANLNRAGLHATSETDVWVFWAFVVPIVNLYRPYQMMKETWNKTLQSNKTLNENYNIDRGAAFIGLWWAWFFLSRIVNQISVRMGFSVETVEDYILSSNFDIFTSVFDILGVFITIFMIKRISSVENDMLKLIEQKNQTESQELSPFKGEQTTGS